MLLEQKEIKLIEFLKTCTDCSVRKCWTKFSKHKSSCLGINSVCKTCASLYDKSYRKTHKNELKIRKKAYREANKNKRKIYCIANKDRIKSQAKTYYKANEKKIKTCLENWRKNNKEKINNYAKIWSKNKRQVDPNFKLNDNISTAIGASLNGNKGGRHWEDLVGYTLEKLVKHLEKLFTNGMNWANYGKGGWVIDHKIPKSVFNFTSVKHKDFRKCWALNNLQPLWAKDNNSKGAKLNKHFQPSLLI